ncbi:MAG: hypothetical protein WDN49_13295 [Acetobacteraceae bacterium]
MRPLAIEAGTTEANAFRQIERLVGMREQRVRRRGMLRRTGDADAHANAGGRDRTEVVRPGQCCADAPRDGHRHLDPGVRQQHGELVAAEPGRNVAFAQLALKPLGELPQERVARCMAEQVVHRLEAVQVEAEDGAGAAGAQVVDRRLQPARRTAGGWAVA